MLFPCLQHGVRRLLQTIRIQKTACNSICKRDAGVEGGCALTGGALIVLINC